jgi:hypothetical protein
MDQFGRYFLCRSDAVFRLSAPAQPVTRSIFRLGPYYPVEARAADSLRYLTKKEY